MKKLGAEIRVNIWKVDIVCIQETHNVKDEQLDIEEYEIYFTKDGEDNETQRNRRRSDNVEKNLLIRYPNRNTSITIQTSKNIQIIYTYAPNTRYNKGERINIGRISENLEKHNETTV